MFRMLVLALVVAVATGDLANEPERFLVSPITKTATVTNTAFASSTVTSFCARLVNVTGACRRKRDVEKPIITYVDDDDVEQILPSLPVAYVSVIPVHCSFFWLIVKYFRLMATEMPVESMKKREAAASSSNIDSSKSEMTVELNGLNSICQTQGRFFGLLNPSNIGLTVFFTTTVTATTTSTTPGPTVIKSFTVQGCTPTPFTFNVCA
jgi:hypothetical protein